MPGSFNFTKNATYSSVLSFGINTWSKCVSASLFARIGFRV
jgi:hypothetical protein